MPEQIKLYSDDFSTVLLETDDRNAARQFLRDSGEKSVAVVIDFGRGWRTRWSGRIVLDDKACISYVGASEYTTYRMPNDRCPECYHLWDSHTDRGCTECRRYGNIDICDWPGPTNIKPFNWL